MYIWTKRECDFEPCEIGAAGASLVADADGGFELAGVGASCDALAHLVPFREDGVDRLALLGAGGRVLVNGFPALGLHVLAERDEICVEGARAYVTSAAAEAPFELGELATALTCPRCTVELSQGDVAHRCARCRTVYHAGKLARPPHETRDCFAYDAVCMVCRELLESWRPEDADG